MENQELENIIEEIKDSKYIELLYELLKLSNEKQKEVLKRLDNYGETKTKRKEKHIG